MTYHFPKIILGSRISLTYKRLTKILRRTWEKSYEVSKIGRQNYINNCITNYHIQHAKQCIQYCTQLNTSMLQAAYIRHKLHSLKISNNHIS